MNRLRAITTCIKHCLLGLGVLVGLSSYGSGLAPLPDAAVTAYPFNTVCKIIAEDGSTASGVLIADNLVLTYAGSFIETLEKSDSSNAFEIEVISALDGSVSAYAVEQFFVEEDYLSTVGTSGLESNASLQRSALILELQERVSGSQAAVVNVNNLSNDGYRMIVAYASDLYGAGGPNAGSLHATDAGEAVYSHFGQVENRLFHSGDLKASQEALGAPMLSYYDGIWSVDGIVVANNVVEGACKVVSIDSVLSDRLVSIVDETGAVLSEASNISSVQDANAGPDSAIELSLGNGRIFSIAPEGDVDYHKFVVSQEGNYVIESFGTLDVSGTLLNGAKQLITSDDDSAGSLNYKLDVTLDPGIYYVKTAPYSGEASGLYGLSLLSSDAPVLEYEDAGYLSTSLIPLDVNLVGGNFQLGNSGEIDTFVLTVSNPGHFIFQLDADYDLKASIFTAVPGAIAPYDSTEIVSVWDQNDDFPGRGSDSVLDVFLPVGEYTVAVEARNSGEFGPYRISTSLFPNSMGITDAADDSGSFATALKWTPGTMVEGKFDEPGDRDSYQFNVSSSSDVLINISSSTDVAWFLYDAELNQVDSSGAAVVDPVIEKALPSGTYYLVVAAMSESTYTLE